MPLIRTIQADGHAKVGIWHITEAADFFREKVTVERTVRHPHKLLQHLAARYLLTELEPTFPVQAVKIMPSRKPYLPENTFHFSVAHCVNYAVAIISPDYRVGIDVERITPKITCVAHKFLHPDELEFINKEHEYEYLTLCWSAKEAVYKWYGKGGVDFSENIRLQPFTLASSGRMSCRFQKDNISAELYLEYLLQREYDVAWLVDTKDKADFKR